MSAAQPAETNTKSNAPIDEDLPPQLHAGKVGYGPNYRAGPTLEEKVRGLKEELLGKVTHNKDRVQHGHQILSGEEKRKQMTGEDEPNPFQGAAEDHSLESPAAGIKKGDSDDQSNTGPTSNTSTPSQVNSTSSATHDAHSTNNATAASDVNQSVPTPTNKVTRNTGASDVNQSVPTATNKVTHNTGASDVNQSVPTPTNRTTHNTGASDVNQSLPTSTTNKNIPNSTINSNVPSTATNNNMPSTTHETHPTGTNTSGHNNLSSSRHNDTTASRGSDSLSQSSYKPAPEKVTFDLNDKKNQERAATVAPQGTEAAEHQRKGGNVSDNKYLN